MVGYNPPGRRTKHRVKNDHWTTAHPRQHTPQTQRLPTTLLTTTWTLTVPKSTTTTTTGPTSRGSNVRQPNKGKWDISNSNSSNLGKPPGRHLARTIRFLEPSMRMLMWACLSRKHLLFSPRFKVSLVVANPRNPHAMEIPTLEWKTLLKRRNFRVVTRFSEKTRKERTLFLSYAKKLAFKNLKYNRFHFNWTLSCILGSTAFCPKNVCFWFSLFQSSKKLHPMSAVTRHSTWLLPASFDVLNISHPMFSWGERYPLRIYSYW